jgi:hypothetical protein
MHSTQKDAGVDEQLTRTREKLLYNNYQAYSLDSAVARAVEPWIAPYGGDLIIAGGRNPRRMTVGKGLLIRRYGTAKDL